MIAHEHRAPLHVRRVIAAFILVPAFAAILLATVQPLYAGLPYLQAVLQTALLYALFGAYPQTLILGVPAFLLLRKHARPTATNCAVTGAVVAALPWFFLFAFAGSGDAWTGGRATRIDGRLTTYGWLELFYFLLYPAVVGAIAGIVFWLIAAGGRQPGSIPEGSA